MGTRTIASPALDGVRALEVAAAIPPWSALAGRKSGVAEIAGTKLMGNSGPALAWLGLGLGLGLG